MVRGRQLSLAEAKVQSMITAVLIGGFVFAHLFDVVAYQLPAGTVRWTDVLNPAAGLSSFGGFAGAVAMLWVWTMRQHQPVMPYADALAAGLAPGWLFGRLGCFTAHDHPGRHTSFFLGVQYPGGARHDLGLDEAIFAAALAAVFLVLMRRRQRAGMFVVLWTLTYAPVRFALDFLRAEDVAAADARYLGLTPAQYGCVIVFVAGLAITMAMKSAGDAGASADQASRPGLGGAP